MKTTLNILAIAAVLLCAALAKAGTESTESTVSKIETRAAMLRSL